MQANTNRRGFHDSGARAGVRCACSAHLHEAKENFVSKHPTHLIPAAILLVALSSCASIATQRRPDDWKAAEKGSKEPLSLFPSDTATMTDAEIARILDVNVRLRSRVRLAVLHLDHRSVDFGWLYVGAGAPVGWLNAEMFAALRKLDRVYDASYLPSVLVPSKLTVAHLREAGARYQADLLLIFRSECQTYQQFRLFRASRAKAYCLADASLLDVRTGLMPFTSRATKDYLIEEKESEIDLAETVRRSEQTAVEAAMLENANNLASFLKSLPVDTEAGDRQPSPY
jgi:hypothetical protein